MASKVLINLGTGLEDGEKVTVAFLVAGAALDRGREVAMFLDARVAGATPMFDWLGDEPGTVFSY